MTDPKAVSAAERITELNAIDQDIVRLIHAAGHAIRALTPSTLPTREKEEDDDNDDDDHHHPPPPPPHATTPSSRRAIFAASTADYFRLLDAIRARLRRQIYALEEADIIPADVDMVTSTSTSTGPPLVVSTSASTGAGATSAGGLGHVDVGWLNSRRDIVGRTMESEHWADARSLLERVQRRRPSKDMDLTEASDVGGRPSLVAPNSSIAPDGSWRSREG